MIDWMMDEGDGELHANRSEAFPDRAEWTGDVLRDVAISMSRQADAAVVLRVLLDEYGWATLTAALEDAARGDTSGAAVTIVDAVNRLYQLLQAAAQRRGVPQ